MSKRQHQKLNAIARFLPDGEHKFLRCLVDYANDAGAGAYPRRKTLIAITGKSRRWLEILERRFVERGWLTVRLAGAAVGCKRRTVYRVLLPDARAVEDWDRQQRHEQRELPFPVAVEKSAEILSTSVDGDRIEYDPGIVFGSEIAFLSDGDFRGLAAPVDSDPKEQGSLERTKEKSGAVAPPSPLWALRPERLRIATRNLKAHLDSTRERQRRRQQR